MKIISWLSRARRPLHIDELLEALAIEDEDKDLERERMYEPFEAMECCKVIVLYEKPNGLVRFSHWTVLDFVEHIEEHLPPASDLAKTCLVYLSFDEFNKTCEELDSLAKRALKYKFYSYASQYWGYHTKDSEDCADIKKGALSLLAADNKRESMLQMEAYAKSFKEQSVVSDGRTILHILAEHGLAKICRRILDERLTEPSNKYFPIVKLELTTLGT